MFTPENELERLLVLASNDPVARPDFYKALAASEIFVIQSETAVTENLDKTVLEAGTKLAFYPVHKGDREMLPFFSSLLRLQTFYGERSQHLPFLALRATEFLNITRGAELVLNPGSDYGKEFTAPEVESILDGWKPSVTYVAKQETPVRLSQPANYPYALTDALSRLFSKIKDVECAYLAHFDNPDQGDPPHTLVGVKASGDWNSIAAQAGIVLNGVEIPDPPVDFYRINGQGGLEDYLLTIKPFYQRKTFGLF